jgi:Ca2+-binding RTX toxin-like protein
LTNPRFRALTGIEIYGRGEDVNGHASGEVLVGAAWQLDPRGMSAFWGDFRITLVDHADGTAADRYGNDYIAGGADDDQIFGELGDDVIQGDGSIDIVVSAVRDGMLTVSASLESASDGEDYIEGNGGNDVIFGNLGQDDIIGGSSSLFGLNPETLRPDGSDLIFGGAGTDIARNDPGDESETGHARDSDVILGDNGNVFRIVGTGGAAFLNFNYDNYNTGTGSLNKIVVRAAQLLDYTPGGDYDGAHAVTDNGAADEIHGESGDDFVYGMVGNDVLFGEAQDDDLIGGWGHDWISGGTGQDGVLGDDGRIFTSRNSSAQGEPLYGITALISPDPNRRFSNGNVLNERISTSGDVQLATINVEGQLKKSVDLTPFNVDSAGNPLFDASNADDIIYGGWGSDFLHGGSGDDAISGAGAPVDFYSAPGNPGDVLGYGDAKISGAPAIPGEFAAYDEDDPVKRIEDFVLDFDASDGQWLEDVGAISYYSDGNDAIFGDLGNDWLVGGTGQDHLYGGYGDDLLNADDDLSTGGGSNLSPDTHSSYADLAYGGAGRDILLGNAPGDRLIDWTGEFNTFVVPFSPFGTSTVSRLIQPGLPEFLYALSASDGADATRAADTGINPTRNGEPKGELGLVTQKDSDWGAQTGAPEDPQPGNNGGNKGGGKKMIAAALAPAENDTVLTQQALDSISVAAIAAWTESLSHIDVSFGALGDIRIQVADLTGDVLGYFDGSNILIDIDGADHGWFIDTSPADNSEFAVNSNTLMAASGSEAFGRMDLLTVVSHEVGHALGFDHDESGYAVMRDVLLPGTRLPLTATPVTPSATSIGVGTRSGAVRPAVFATMDDAGVPIPAPIVIDWKGSAFAANAGTRSASSSDFAGWTTDFANHLGRNESERNPNANIRLLVPQAAIKVVSDAARRIGSLFG